MDTAETIPAERIRLTYEDYVLIPDDGRRHEIIDGEEYVSPAPKSRHQSLLLRLAAPLFAHVRAKDLGALYIAPFDVLISEHDIVQPDLLFISKERMHLVDEDNLKGAPDLVVEILSDSTRRHDLIRKRRLYERAGVREYWVIDPEIDQVQIFRLEGKVYERKAEMALEDGGAITSPLLPGFEMALDDLFS